MTGLSANRTQKRGHQSGGSIPILSFTAARIRCLQPRYRSSGTETIFACAAFPSLKSSFYLSLAAEIEPEGRRLAGTLESAGVFSDGVLRGTRWFEGATLSSYSMGSPKPSVWTPTLAL